MNSEELELSLRTEFEQHLKAVRAEMKQQLAAFQTQVHGDITKHIDSAFSEFSGRFDAMGTMDNVLQESVIEHLRLARDNGAQLAASAAAEAEQLSREHAASVAGFDQLRDAVAAISAQTTQAGILKTLTEYATRFAPRGAFFIIKNDQFVGWQVFGNGSVSDDAKAKSISFSVDTDSIMGSAVRCLSSQQGSFGLHSEDSKFLKPLDFGKPNSMVAVPLIARGRGVAVLYADSGTDGSTQLNVGALETLVRIAGITVELQAAAQAIRTQTEMPGQVQQPVTPTHEVPVQKVEEPAEIERTAYVEKPTETVEEYAYASPEAETVEEPAPQIETYHPIREEFSEDTVDDVISVEPEATLEDEAYLMSDSVEEVIYTDEVATIEEPTLTTTDFAFASDEPPVIEEEPAIAYDDGFANGTGNGASKPETVPAQVVSFNGRSRRERNLDLPIEVSEDEREEHTKARKFARLLVSEIKLYNEKQVKEGRERRDLYDRLREAVDRSRDMYNKRVTPPVTTKFDYFHYELVNSLAEGDESRLGNNYPKTGN